MHHAPAGSEMEKVLAENRRLQLLCEKMSAERDRSMVGDTGRSSAAFTPRASALGFFEDDSHEGSRCVNRSVVRSDEFSRPDTGGDLSFGPLSTSGVEDGHRLFVDQMLGVSSLYLSQSGESVQVAKRSDELSSLLML